METEVENSGDSRMREALETQRDFVESGSRAESIIEEALRGSSDGAEPKPDSPDVLRLKFSILRKALERIDDGIMRTSPNCLSTNLSLVEIKAIAETALASV